MPEHTTSGGAGGLAATTHEEPAGLRWRYVLSYSLFFIAYRILGLRRGVIRRNLQRSLPQSDAKARTGIAREFVRRQS